MNVWSALIISFYIGIAVGWWFNRKPPIITVEKITANLVVDENMMDQIQRKIDQETVFYWLEKRGLTWMPKGAVFDHGKKNETPR